MTNRVDQPLQRLKTVARAAVAPSIVFVVSFGLLHLFAWNRAEAQSNDPHFVYLAQAFLEGQLELTKPPPHGNDWASYEVITLKSGEVVKGVFLDQKTRKFKTLDGRLMYLDHSEIDYRIRPETKTYVSFPPGPALLMMPLVLLQGWEANDVLFTLFLAALNIALLHLLLVRLRARGLIELNTGDRIWLLVMFAMGSTHLWCSILGQVWFTALVVGVTFTLLYVHAAIDTKHPLLAGLCLGVAFASRVPLVFAAVFFVGLVLFPNGRFIGLSRQALSQVGKKLVLFSVFPLIIGITLLWMNEARFENALEFGHTYLAKGGFERIQKYGLFNYHFLSTNLSAAFTLLPRLQLYEPYVIVSRHGMSIFLSMPVLLALFFGRSRPHCPHLTVEREPDRGSETVEPESKSENVSREVTAVQPTSATLRFWHRLTWVTTGSVALPAFFYQNTGWEQFSYRFVMDYLVYLTVLLALSRTRLSWGFKALIVLGVIVNVFGALTFQRAPEYYDDWFFDPGR